MDELISKKELLEKYGISYGALYRWKRMGLIPEDWFEKKSAVTGQETFFPRAAITERIEMILELKDQMSLEEIAAKVNGETPEKTRHLRIIWDGGTTQIPLSKIHSIAVTENSGSERQGFPCVSFHRGCRGRQEAHRQYLCQGTAVRRGRAETLRKLSQLSVL